MAIRNYYTIIVANETTTEEEVTKLQEAFDALERGASWEDEMTGETVNPAIIVRVPRQGEAEGTYKRMALGDLQILGYTVPVPDGLADLIDRAYAQAFRV